MPLHKKREPIFLYLFILHSNGNPELSKYPLCSCVGEQLRISAAEAARKPTGKVVGIIKRNWRPFCGMLNVSQIKEVTLDCSIYVV